MAAPFLRVGRLSEQRLRMENSFGIFRRTPGLMNFSTKAGNPKKPIRYTSIKKANPKTIIDIGKLLLQRANDAKVNKQSAIADAALKAATQTTKLTTLEQSTSSSDSASTVASSAKAPPAASPSDAESVTPIATSGSPLGATRFVVNATPKVTDAIKGLAMSSPSVKDVYEATRSVEQEIVQEKVPEPSATNIIPPEAFSSSELSAPFGTSLDNSVGEISESTTVPSNDLDKIASTPIATLETGSKAVPIDVTYSEEVHVTDREAATETSVGVLSTTGTVTTEIVCPQSVGAINVPAAPEIFGSGPFPAGCSSTQSAPTAEDIENICALENATSTSSGVAPSAAAAKMQDVRPLTPETLVYTASCSKSLPEEGTIAHEMTPEANSASNSVLELEMTKNEISHTLLLEDAAIQDVDSKEGKTSSEADPVKTVISDLKSSAEETVAMPEKVLNLTSEHVFEASVAQSPYPPNHESAEEELKAEGDETFKESSDAPLDPIQRLFLDKIREYSNKSKTHDGLVDADPEYERAFSEELTKLQRLYGNGDLTAFPEFNFPEPVLDESAPSK